MSKSKNNSWPSVAAKNEFARMFEAMRTEYFSDVNLNEFADLLGVNVGTLRHIRTQSTANEAEYDPQHALAKELLKQNMAKISDVFLLTTLSFCSDYLESEMIRHMAQLAGREDILSEIIQFKAEAHQPEKTPEYEAFLALVQNRATRLGFYNADNEILNIRQVETAISNAPAFIALPKDSAILAECANEAKRHVYSIITDTDTEGMINNNSINVLHSILELGEQHVSLVDFRRMAYSAAREYNEALIDPGLQ